MNSIDDLEDITKQHSDVNIDDDDELDLIKLVSTNANDTSQYLIFVGSDDQYYAKNVSKIEELLVYKDLKIVKNNETGLIIGTADIRGNMTTIVNFDKWFGNEVLDDKDYELVILAHYGGHRMGIVVKRVEYIVNIPSDTMVDNSENNEKTSFITNVLVSGKEELCLIFDSDKFLLDVFDKIDAKRIDDTQSLQEKPQSTKKVYFADDSRFVRKMVEELFKKLEVSYAMYENGQELIDALENESPDNIALFITDLEMPVLCGREVMRYIMKHPEYEGINIIVHTNMSNDNMEKSLMDDGADAIIGKVNMLKLGEAINQYIR